MFRDDSWFGWWISTRCWSTPRIHVTSKWWWFCSDRIDSRTHEDLPSSGSEGHVSFGSIRNWSLSQIHEKWRIYLVDCHFQNEQVCGRTSRRKRRICPLRRWLLIPAWRSPLRQNTRDNQVHNHISSPRCSYQLTNGIERCSCRWLR